jgi:formamidopyrimidine-DNA glycosylase
VPELPEVETTRRGIEPLLVGRGVSGVTVRNFALRWPVTEELVSALTGATVLAVRRRAKYLLLQTAAGAAILHFGMSGSLRFVPSGSPPGRHDHVDLVLADNLILRYTDPRRFGCLLWAPGDPLRHPLLAHLGPEPLEAEFDGTRLRSAATGKRVAVKSLIMDSRVVVGVGNIYASEALFVSRIHPARPCGRISALRLETLAQAIRQILQEAIDAGGTTLRDFTNESGRPGYFARQLRVYGRGGEPCLTCGQAVRVRRIGQRASYYCSTCQR